eukprot:Nitzschia sp. Nitz4//scaffold10_size219509//43496//45655//NITZ4_001405-RA/size219509-processed-gene-0.118-mRNA-1//-1//CDS//3329532851//7508//frame0
MTAPIRRWIVLGLLLLSLAGLQTASAAAASETKKRLTRKEWKQKESEAKERYVELRRQGVDEVGHTQDAANLRAYKLRKKKTKGLLRKKEADLASILFPGVSPELYVPKEEIWVYTDLVNSKKTQVPFEFYDLPGCPAPVISEAKKKRQRKNLGARLQGIELKPAPYSIKTKVDVSCTPLCIHNIKPKRLRWLRKLVERQYRIHMTLDSLPVLMRSSEQNFAVRGFPVGFKASPDYTGLPEDQFFLYNHLKFVISYNEVPDSAGSVHITGFDVYPVSMKHDIPSSELTDGTTITTCNAPTAKPVVNDPSTFLALQSPDGKADLPVMYSYEVEWELSPLDWADRWDVYLIGGPDDDIHSFAIINSLMIVLFLTGAIATIMVRTLRQDIAGYNEMSSLDEEETGWKLVHGDVFRPPSTHPMLFSVLVGTGAQIGAAFLATMLCSMVRLINPMHKGQTLTAILILYVLCGSVAGYISARLFKFCDETAWKRNTAFTAAALPGVLAGLFIILNVFLHIVGAATAVGFVSIILLFGLYFFLSIPSVFAGSFLGFRENKLSVPVKTNQIARYIPELPWYASPPYNFLIGGVLPFGSVCIELFFIMSALWLHQIYYMMGFLLAVLLILGATCAEVSVVMSYMQLCAEDHRWWWKSFFNCASAGLYLFLYSLWFLVSRLELVGLLPVVVYITYMGMISLCFALFCGSVGVLSSFWFIRVIYGELKVD